MHRQMSSSFSRWLNIAWSFAVVLAPLQLGFGACLAQRIEGQV